MLRKSYEERQTTKHFVEGHPGNSISSSSMVSIAARFFLRGSHQLRSGHQLGSWCIENPSAVCIRPDQFLSSPRYCCLRKGPLASGFIPHGRPFPSLHHHSHHRVHFFSLPTCFALLWGRSLYECGQRLSIELSLSQGHKREGIRKDLMHRSASVRRSLTTSSLHPAHFVRIVEVGPRDGLQNEPTLVPTPLKLELIHRLSKTGLRTIEATSFVNKKIIPQLSDASDILAGLGMQRRSSTQHSHTTTAVPQKQAQFVPDYLPSPISYPVLVPNTHFLSAAIQAGAREIAIFGSCSEAFSQRNINCSISASLQRFKGICEIAKAEGIRIRGYLSCVIGCPYDGPTSPKVVLNLTRELLNLGCYEVSLGDTIGVGTPFSVRHLLRVLTEGGVDPRRIAGHFHDTYGQALSNVLASLDFGVRTFDASVSGLGGCPFAKGATGNLATEDLVYMLHNSGYDTGVELTSLVHVGDWISRELGRVNGSRSGTALSKKMTRTAGGSLGSSPKI